ncbi:MAG: T9SS type A sorting domain-containing protein [candidate division WOR-3 bacterium]
MIDGADLAISPHNPELIFSCGYGSINSAYRIQTSYSTDNGSTWIRDTLPDSIARANTILFDPFDSTRILIGGDSAYNYKLLLLTTDLGATWQHIGNGLTGIIYRLAASQLTPGLFYAGTSQGLFKSTDGGENWTRTGSFTNVRCIALDQTNDDIIYAGTGNGIYLTTDGGENWQQINEGLTNTDILCLGFRSDAPRTVFAGTNGAGIFAQTPPTGVVEPEKHTSSRELDIEIGPNPCRSIVNIVINAPKAQSISGGIYDRSGRIIHDLKKAILANGQTSYQVDLWNLPSGIYFLRLKIGKVNAIKRFVKVN